MAPQESTPQEMTAQEWIGRYASLLGVPAPTDAEITEILALAGDAAHASERIAAPVACWLAASTGMHPTDARAVAGRVASP